jgi:hypothetical protein
MRWKLITEERYDEMLGVLPPALQTGLGFLVGEPYDHDAQGRPRFTGFVCLGEHFFESDSPMTCIEFRAVNPMDVYFGYRHAKGTVL